MTLAAEDRPGRVTAVRQGQPPSSRRWLTQSRAAFSLICRYAIAAAAITGAWYVASEQFDSPILFPGPLKTLDKAIELVSEGRLQADILASLQRIFAGFLIGSLVGSVIGLAMGSFRLVADVLQPLVNFVRFIAPIAWIGTVMVWFGLGEISKVALIIYATVFVVMLSAIAGVASVHRNKIRAAQCLGSTPRQIFVWVTFPAALSFILTGMRMAMMNAFMTVVSAEMIAAESGLGYLIYNSRQWMETDAIFVGMLTLGVVGLLTDRLFVLLTRTALRRFSLQ
ncbi:MAG TPA: ABC transporter permease [Vineibacter sp.]|nr:ABC transporter permease [Vineibacter sp.]